MGRHGIAFALFGWYLIIPPLDQIQTKEPEKAPFVTWTISQSFDSARECERAKKALVARTSKEPVNSEGMTKRENDLLNKHFSPATAQIPFKAAAINLETSAVCIATDDPRLDQH